MFICKSCADNVFGGAIGSHKSYGTCKECGKIDNCFDIHPARLSNRNPVPLQQDTAIRPVQELQGMNRDDPLKQGKSRHA